MAVGVYDDGIRFSELQPYWSGIDTVVFANVNAGSGTFYMDNIVLNSPRSNNVQNNNGGEPV